MGPDGRPSSPNDLTPAPSTGRTSGRAPQRIRDPATPIVSLLAGGIVLVGDPERTGMLVMRIQQWSVILVVDLVWSFSYTLWPRGGSKQDVRPMPQRGRPTSGGPVP